MKGRGEKIKHWGIWIGGSVQRWMTFGPGDIFWTLSRIVAQEQLKQGSFANDPNAEVREFKNESSKNK